MKNKGFSLIEIIIAIAILAIITTSAIIISGTHLGWRVNKAVKMVDSTISEAKVQAMSKGNVKGVIFYQLDNQFYAATIHQDCRNNGAVYQLNDSNIVKKVNLGGSPLTITAIYKPLSGNGSTYEEVLTNQTSEANMTVAAQILFDKGSGAMSPVVINNVDYKYAGIKVEFKDRENTVVIYPTTGNVEVN